MTSHFKEYIELVERVPQYGKLQQKHKCVLKLLKAEVDQKETMLSSNEICNEDAAVSSKSYICTD